MVVRGGNEGGLDGIDVWGTNIWVHDVEVTNKDECVTVKACLNSINLESKGTANFHNRVLQVTLWWRTSSATGAVDALLDLWEPTPVCLKQHSSPGVLQPNNCSAQLSSMWNITTSTRKTATRCS
jgi:hypothetical protein